MKIAYFDCYSGISGDMCLGALIDAGAPVDEIRGALAGLPLRGWDMATEKVLRGGISATKVDVTYDRRMHAEARNYREIAGLISEGGLPERAAEIATETFRLLAEAEAAIHARPVEEVHFHEVGAVDSIIDITGAALAFCMLGIEKAFVSPIAAGGGEVETMHGILPAPAPATMRLLEGFRVRGGPVQHELATPTGAALLRCLAGRADAVPCMNVERTGYGAGARDFQGRSNTLRVVVGTGADDGPSGEQERVWMLETNLDDMTGEEMGFLLEEALARGALDAFISPVQMKKNRPAFRFAVLCGSELKEELTDFLLRKSSTLGVRYWPVSRSRLEREMISVSTPWGDVRVKVAMSGGETVHSKPEFEDCRRIARREGIALRDVYDAVSVKLHRERDAREATQ